MVLIIEALDPSLTPIPEALAQAQTVLPRCPHADNFADARKSVMNAGSRASFLICDEYELHRDPGRTTKVGGPFYYTHPKYPLRFKGRLPLIDESRWHVYAPMQEDPDLFLKFARLHEEERSPLTALRWTNEHGPLATDAGIYMDRDTYENKGGDPAEPVEDFFEEVDRAATVLSLYEAVLGRDQEAVRTLIREGPSPFVAWMYENFWTQIPGDEEHDNDMMTFGLHTLIAQVTRMVRTYAYPQLHVPAELTDLSHLSRVRQGWGFDNLLGAMYLQMYWLIAAGEKNIAHCKYCGKVISLKTRTPDPNNPSKTRKPRQDKQFCDNRCQQRHYYHTREKVRRKVRRSEE